MTVNFDAGEQKKLKTALDKFMKKYGTVDYSFTKSPAKGFDKGMAADIAVDTKHAKGLEIVISMALSNYKLWLDGKPIQTGK